MRIDRKIYQETGTSNVPLESKRKLWQRLDCPYCGHERAVINYSANWFQCWACGAKRSGYDDEALAVVRFGVQIDRAVRTVKDRFGNWLNGDEDDIANVARWHVWNYSEGEPGGKDDAGRLAEWETECNAEDEPWRLGAKVQTVLDRDLMNWASGQKRWKEHNQLSGDMQSDDTEAGGFHGLVTEPFSSWSLAGWSRSGDGAACRRRERGSPW
jgi:hypothetical protein